MSAAIQILMLFVSSLLSPAVAYESGGLENLGAHGDTSIGGRMSYFRPRNADRGDWGPGAQIRVHMSQAYALETSIDFFRYPSQQTSVRTVPIQITMLSYFYPESSLTPFFLFGGGWYRTRADGPFVNDHRRFGPHAGGGLELLLGRNWSVSASYRYLWTQIFKLGSPFYLGGQRRRERGYMISTNLNYRL
ncbi:MAG: outer membrane beta-barrel protein [Elusimicrobia bacterium]|nr:outer membrane beta-barrel protein [Elusimicrobiota bacterium]